MSREHMEQGFKTLRLIIAIPASNAAVGSIKNWADLASLTGSQKAKCLAVYCSAYIANSATQRGAMVVSDVNSAFTNAEYIAQGQEYYRPVCQDHLNSFPADPANVGFNALAIFVLLATEGSC